MSNAEFKNKKSSLNNYKFLDNLNLDQDVINRLSINLLRTQEGSNDVLVTPIAKEHGAENLLAEWDKVFQANASKMNEVLIKMEEDQKSKAGPTSIAVPWDRRKIGIEQYFEDTKYDYSSLDALPEALSDRGILRPLSLQNAARFLKNDTNSGLPFYTRKDKVKERVLARFQHYLDRRDPCILFTRTLEQEKTRNIWGFPIADTLNEMCYYRPLLEYQRKLHWRSALNGPEAVNKKMTHIITTAVSKGYALLSEDFSRYDSTIKPNLQRKIREYYYYLFQTKYHPGLTDIVERKINIGLVTPDGVETDEHAEPSGSTFTNEDGSIGHKTVAKQSGLLIDDLYDFQSDDGALAILANKVEEFYSFYDKFGLIINKEKSYVSRDYLIYLQCLFHIDYIKNGVIGGIYPVYRALNRILYQARWSNFEDFGIQGKDYYSIRTICLLENVKHHPLFEELVRFVYKYDKYKLQASNKGIDDYVRMIKASSGIEGILVHQYKDNITGIRNFESYKLIAELNKA